MKNTILFILFIVLLLISSKVISQTNVSGPYFVNTIWDLNGSPYNVIGDVQIPNGVSLTIDAGVEINFNSDYEILIKGDLIAIGTNNLPIIFNGNINGRSMLIFKDTDLNNTQLSFLEFNGPKNALQLADESEFNQDIIKNSGTLTISEVAFNNTRIQTDGYKTTANLLIQNALITITTIQGTYPKSEKIELKNSTINNSVVTSDSYNDGIIIDGCIADNTEFSIGCCGANLQILNSNIENSNIVEGNGNPKIGPVIIIESEINNSPINLPVARVEITNSTVSYDTPNGLIFGNGVLECSQITGNNTGVAVKITGYQGYNIGNSVVISNSTIKDNSIGIDIVNANIVTMSNSNIYNNSTYNIRNSSSRNISAINNWWGTTTAIDNTIYDYYDNINNGVVDYSNYLNAFEDISNNCPNLSVFIDEFKSLKTKIYPNPNNGNFTIKLENSSFNNIEIYNSIGMIVYSEVVNGQSQISINLPSSLKDGMYVVKLIRRDSTTTQKLILKRD